MVAFSSTRDVGGGAQRWPGLTVSRPPVPQPESGDDDPTEPATDDDSFAECYAASFTALTTQLYVYTGDLGLAQELVQEAFCRALARWSKISRYQDPVAWVRRVAFNLANSRWQRAKISMRYLRGQREQPVDGPSPDRVAAVRALAQLPPHHRRAMVMYYLADLPIAEIAAQERVAVGTVKSWLSRGRSTLAGLLSEAGEGNV